MTRLVASLGWSGRWTVRSSAFADLTVRRDARGDLTIHAAGGVVFRLVRRDQSFVVEGLGAAAEFRSALHDDGVRRVWFVDSASFTGSATEKGTMRSFGRLLGHVFGPAPVHLIVPLSLVIADDAGPAGRCALGARYRSGTPQRPRIACTRCTSPR